MSVEQNESLITEALHSALPLTLHYLITPIARYVMAASLLRDLAGDPGVAQALGDLQYIQVRLSGGIVNFDTDAITLTLRDAGRQDIFTITIKLMPQAAPVVILGPDRHQMVILTALYHWPDGASRSTAEEMAAHLELSAAEVERAYAWLEDKGYISGATDEGGRDAEIAPKGRSLVQQLERLL